MMATPAESGSRRPGAHGRIRALALATTLATAACAPATGVTSQQAEPAAETPLVTPETDPAPEEPAPAEPAAPPAPDTPWPGEDAATDELPGATEPSIRTDVELAAVAEVGDDKQPRPYDDLVAAAIADIDAWLAELHPRLHDEPWEPLDGGIWPSYPGRTDIPGCGETRTDPADVSEFVAFYCAGRDFLVYDDGPGSLLGELAAEFGPSVMGVVLAHEYGHVVQDRLDVFDRGLPTVVTEQQADCFSGAWVDRLASGTSPYLTLTDADIRGALISMVAVRDPVGIDQFEPGGHGSAFDRIGAFQEGFTAGPERCDELLDDPLPLMPNEFQTTTDLLNEGDLPFGYGEGAIVPLVVDALNSFWPFQLEALDSGTFAPMRLVPVEAASEIACSARPELVAPGLATCVADGTVYLDDGFARRLYQDPIVGSADFAVGYFVALAWADVAQSRLGSDLTGADRALANDCLVGAWTRDLDPDRADRPDEIDRGIISPGDLDEAVVAAIEVGDTAPAADDLGVAFDKVGAFRSGVLGQIDACLGLLSP
ncbi:MAG: hypothetical protein WD225_10290 [Ilumatobacteraceae bacterium]